LGKREGSVRSETERERVSGLAGGHNEARGGWRKVEEADWKDGAREERIGRGEVRSGSEDRLMD